jgi:lysophospholipase L1-like esterase
MTHIMMIGDCTLATTYLPVRLRNERALESRLRELYADESIRVTNEGLDGEAIGQFLKRYDRTFARNAPPDYILIRYGVNDRKAYGVDGFRDRLTELCDRLAADLPRARVVLETGIYVDYPDHYEFDRNAVLQPIYDVIRELGDQRGLPVVDIYERMRRETEQGNWDLRVRGYGVVDDEIPIYTNSLDHLHEGDVRWWTNIHPNPEGLRVIADEEAIVLRRHWPDTLAIT